MEKALKVLKNARENSCKNQTNRPAKVLGFEMKNGVLEALLEMPREALLNLVGNLAAKLPPNKSIWKITLVNQQVLWNRGMSLRQSTTGSARNVSAAPRIAHPEEWFGAWRFTLPPDA